jgi:hypothetical protein
MIKLLMYAGVMLLFSAGLYAGKAPRITFTNDKGAKMYTYMKGAQIFISVEDPDANTDITKKDVVTINISSETEQKGENLTLSETGVTTGVFTSKIMVNESSTAVPDDNVLQVERGDKLTAKYAMPKDDKGIERNIDDQAYYCGPSWTFENTGENHTVLIPESAVITIDGKPIEKGDFISCFYTVTEGDKTVLKNAGGTGREIAPGGVRWMGKTTATAAWGAQEGKKNGFAPNEEFKWKIWRASDGKEFDAVASYMVDERIPDKGLYIKDGISGIQTLSAKSK